MRILTLKGSQATSSCMLYLTRSMRSILHLAQPITKDECKNTYGIQGVDSSYHVQTDVLIRRALFEALAYTIYIREKVFFSFLSFRVHT